MYYGDSFADKATMRLEGKIKGIYAQAYEEIEEKLKKFLEKSAIKEKVYKQKVKDGKMTQAEFDRWKSGQVFIGKRWKDLKQNIAEEMYHTRKSATDMINGERKAVFQNNVNYTQYTIDKDFRFGISFDLYDTATVTRLINDDPDLVPDIKYPDPNIDYAWSKKQIAGAITQGVLQGESIPDLAKRIGRKLESSNTVSMVRCARTAMTGAQNSGRIQAMHNAQDMGIKVQKRWISTLDRRTRDAHRNLDEQLRDVDKPFDSDLGEIMYPGDPDASPANVWNCRCSLGWNYPEYSSQYDTRAARAVDWEEEGQTEQVPYMTYREWEEWKQTGQLPQRGIIIVSQQNTEEEVEEQQIEDNSFHVVEGKNIIDTWQRRPEQFEFEIEDVMNAQGFDGNPRIVDAKEFDEFVKEANDGHGFIAQRSYSAEDTETLDAYREQLYSGKWYVDCSTGGAQYGQGMYCAADYTGTLSEGIKNEMEHYRGLYDRKYGKLDEEQVKKAIEVALERDKKDAEKTGYTFDENERKDFYRWLMIDMKMSGDEIEKQYGVKGNSFLAPNYVETLTLDKSAKIITFDKATELQKEYTSRTLARKAYESNLKSSETFEHIINAVKEVTGETITKEKAKRLYESRFAEYALSDPDKIRQQGTEWLEFRKEHKLKVPESVKIWGTFSRKIDEEIDKGKQVNIGSLMALLGYDAINAEGHGESDSYTVVLNRTKLIIKRPDND